MPSPRKISLQRSTTSLWATSVLDPTWTTFSLTCKNICFLPMYFSIRRQSSFQPLRSSQKMKKCAEKWNNLIYYFILYSSQPFVALCRQPLWLSRFQTTALIHLRFRLICTGNGIVMVLVVSLQVWLCGPLCWGSWGSMPARSGPLQAIDVNHSYARWHERYDMHFNQIS